MEVGKTMQKTNYRILNNTLFEVASSRKFTEKDNLAELFNEEGKIVLVTDRAKAGLTLAIVKNEEAINFLVTWDDSEEYFAGWNMAWEEFLWCLGVATTPAPSAEPEVTEEVAAEEALVEVTETEETVVVEETPTTEETSTTEETK